LSNSSVSLIYGDKPTLSEFVALNKTKEEAGTQSTTKKKTEEKVKRDLQREKLEEQNASFLADSQQSEQKKKEKERNRNRNRNRNTEHRKNSKVKQTTAPCVGVCWPMCLACALLHALRRLRTWRFAFCGLRLRV